MIAQAKANRNMKVLVLQVLSKTIFSGKVVKDANGWKKDEICTHFAIGDFDIVHDMQEYIKIIEMLGNTTKILS